MRQQNIYKNHDCYNMIYVRTRNMYHRHYQNDTVPVKSQHFPFLVSILSQIVTSHQIYLFCSYYRSISLHAFFMIGYSFISFGRIQHDPDCHIQSMISDHIDNSANQYPPAISPCCNVQVKHPSLCFYPLPDHHKWCGVVS